MIKALVVDDDIPTAEVIRVKINWAAFSVSEVKCAYNIHDAWNIILADGPRLILCDIEMPKGSGLELIRRARENDIGAKFIFITCHADFTYATQALDFEASAYITKPLNLPKIEEAIARAVKAIKRGNPSVFAYDDPVAQKIAAYIDEHCAENITRDELAAHVFLSPNHLSKVFKEKMGCAMADYINGARVAKAKELLALPLYSVAEVAARVGFDNTAYFSTVFRKATGQSPRKYRQNA
ncbi:MAG: helix-turn-helix domain-containing protein [Clostridiales bacterium]|jgi:YesN/AraC family two-component response regulator|nr:helix-turn-helix domain-containing protein [Clostridiales bacterium]